MSNTGLNTASSDPAKKTTDFVVLMVASLLATLTAAAAQEVPLTLHGRSMIGERVERITYNNGTFDQHWIVKLYFSREGRIFAKQTLNSGNPRNASGTIATISDRAASLAPFTWDGTGASRQWTNPTNGVILRLSLTIDGRQNTSSCAINLDRQNVSDFSVRVLKETCRVYKGNAAAD